METKLPDTLTRVPIVEAVYKNMALTQNMVDELVNNTKFHAMVVEIFQNTCKHERLFEGTCTKCIKQVEES